MYIQSLLSAFVFLSCLKTINKMKVTSIAVITDPIPNPEKQPSTNDFLLHPLGRSSKKIKIHCIKVKPLF